MPARMVAGVSVKSRQILRQSWESLRFSNLGIFCDPTISDTGFAIPRLFDPYAAAVGAQSAFLFPWKFAL